MGYSMRLELSHVCSLNSFQLVRSSNHNHCCCIPLWQGLTQMETFMFEQSYLREPLLTSMEECWWLWCKIMRDGCDLWNIIQLPYIWIYMYVCVYVCAFIYMFVCIYLYVNVCFVVCIYVCVSVYICIYLPA